MLFHLFISQRVERIWRARNLALESSRLTWFVFCHSYEFHRLLVVVNHEDVLSALGFTDQLREISLRFGDRVPFDFSHPRVLRATVVKDHFPIQNELKIRFRMSSAVVAPVISSSGRRAL